jgi:solute carrier family 41
LISAGYLLDNIQHWVVFERISELVILVPVLLGLKGNLEMNLASRISTAANLFQLDDPESRRSILTGNMALILIQSISIGLLAGVFSSILGYIVHAETNGATETLLVYAASMWTAAVSGFILGMLMCAIVLVSRRLRVNPDNIATPLAASLGDLVTLGVLALSSQWIYVAGKAWSIALITTLSLAVPMLVYIVRQNSDVKKTITQGWFPLVVSVLISSFGGLILERYIGQYKSMALLSTVLNGLMGNMGAIYCSRIATSLHGQISENHRQTVVTLCLVSVPIHLIFMLSISILQMGHTELSPAFLILYGFTAMFILLLILMLSRWICMKMWTWGYNPHNYALPYVTSTADIIGTILESQWQTLTFSQKPGK